MDGKLGQHICSAPLLRRGETSHAICFPAPLFLSRVNCVDFSAFPYLLFYFALQSSGKKRHPTSFRFCPPDPGKMNRSARVMSVLRAPSPLFLLLYAPPRPPLPLLPPISSTRNLILDFAWNEAGRWGSPHSPQTRAEILMPPQAPGCHPRRFLCLVQLGFRS